MDRPTCSITNALAEAYSEAHTSPEDDVLYQINRSIHLHTSNPRMSSGPYQGRWLQMVSEMLVPKVVVEIGVFAGYATICLARGLAEGGVLYAVEAEDEYEDFIRENLRLTAMEDRVNLCIGRALQVIPTLPDDIDLVYLDADKINYLQYYELLVPKIRKGGILMIDNVLWSGKVLYDQPQGDRETAVLKSLNDKIQADPRVENVLLPIRDGLMMVRIK